MSDRFYIQHIVLCLILFPSDQHPVAADAKHVVVSTLERFEKVIWPVLDFGELAPDALLCFRVKVVEPVTTSLSVKNVDQLHVFSRNNVAVLDLLSGNAVVFERLLREAGAVNEVPDGIPHEFVFIDVVRIGFEEQLDIFLHLVGDFDVQCAHCAI